MAWKTGVYATHCIVRSTPKAFGLESNFKISTLLNIDFFNLETRKRTWGLGLLPFAVWKVMKTQFYYRHQT